MHAHTTPAGLAYLEQLKLLALLIGVPHEVVDVLEGEGNLIKGQSQPCQGPLRCPTALSLALLNVTCTP